MKTSGFHPALGRPALVLGILAALALMPRPVVAALNYQTYVIQQNDNYVFRDSQYVDSISYSYVLTPLGSVSLEAPALTITSKGSYLDIVEEGTLSGNIDNRPNNSTLDFLFQGSLPIPPNAAVRGLEVYHDDTLFVSTLKPMTYSLNNVFTDSAALATSLNGRVAFLQQLSDQGFEATFAKVALGQPITVRIRYELPLPGSPSAPISIPLIFQPSGEAPKTVNITFFEDDSTAAPFQWMGSSGPVTLHDKDIQTVPYSPSFTFQRVQPPHTLATLQTSDFSSGDWSGHYLLLNAGLNDSIMTLLSHPMETVFLWRWNNPANFVTTDGTGLKTLSAQGLLAVSEAQYMRQLAVELGARGHRFGLLHVIDGRDSVFFPPAGENDSGFTRLLAYLNGSSSQNLFSAYQNAKTGKPGWAPVTWTDSNSISQSQADFLSALNKIQKSYENQSDLHHIIMLGTGDVTSTAYDLTQATVVQTILDSTTIVNYNAEWPGVDLGNALAIVNAAPLQLYSSVAAPPSGLYYLSFPIFQPSSVEYLSFTQNRVHAVVMPFADDAQTQAVMKATTPFGDSLELQGIDALGRNTRLLTLMPHFTDVAQDSGLARLWAADPNRIFENSESSLGMRYGILSKEAYLSAGEGTGILTGPDGNPIIAVKAASSFTRSPAFQISMDYVVINVPLQSNMVLQVFDLRGRLLFVLPLDAYRFQNGFRIPLSLFRNLGMNHVTLRLLSQGRTYATTLWLGGAK